MTLELDRLNSGYTRVVVGVLIQQGSGHKSFVGVLNPGLRMREGYTVLAEDNFGGVLGATAATVGEFVRDVSGEWTFHPGIHGYDTDPAEFPRVMGTRHDA
jgi:tellurium resistance protein TerD